MKKFTIIWMSILMGMLILLGNGHSAFGQETQTELAKLTADDITLDLQGTTLENGHYHNIVKITSIAVKNTITDYTNAKVQYAVTKGLDPIEYTDFQAGGIEIKTEGTHTFYYTVKVKDYDLYTSSKVLSIDSLRTPKVVMGPAPATYFTAPTITLTSSLTGAEIYYTLDGSTPSKTTTLYENPFTLAGTGKITVKARAYKEGYVTDSVAVGTYQLEVITPATLPTTLLGGKNTIDKKKGWYGMLGSDYSSEPKLKFDATGSFLFVSLSEACGKLTYTIKGNGTTNVASVFDVETSEDGKIWTVLKSYTGTDINGVTIVEELRNIPLTARQIRWIYTNKAAGNVALGNLSIEKTSLVPEIKIAENPLRFGSHIHIQNFFKDSSVIVSGQNLTQDITLTKIDGSSNFTLGKNTLTAAELNDPSGVKLNIHWEPINPGNDSVIIEFASNEIKDTLRIYGETNSTVVAKSIADLYANYENVDPAKFYLLLGDVVVTHIDSNINTLGELTLRIWMQDSSRLGRSIALYKEAGNTVDLKNIKVGDVLSIVNATLSKYNGLLQLIPTKKPSIASSNHAIYVDTVSVAQIKGNPVFYQNKLVFVKNVVFNSTANFATGTSYQLIQKSDTLEFRTDYKSADYIGTTIPTEKLHITGILGQYNTTPQLVARKLADMVTAPCLAPNNFTASTTSTTAIVSFSAEVDFCQYRYATTNEGLSTASAVGIKTKEFSLNGLTELTTYFYQVKSICAEAFESEWSAAKSFTTLSSAAPALTLNVPVTDSIFTGAASFAYKLDNFTLGIDGKVSIQIGDKEAVLTTELSYTKSLLSGDYTAVLSLVDMSGNALSPEVKVSRTFRVNLPNVAMPIFTPKVDSFYTHAIDVNISCETADAKIYYTQDGSNPTTASTLYVAPISITSNATFKTIAVKDGFDASSIAVGSYKLRINPTPEGDIVLAENFDNFTAGSISGAHSVDISEKLDEYTTEPGWKGSRVYQAGGYAKMGGGSAHGFLQLPDLNLSHNDGKFYIAFFAQAWENDATSLYLIVNGDTTAVEPLSNSGDANREYVYILTGGLEKTSIRIAGKQTSNSRFFLGDLRIYQKLPAVPTIMVASMTKMNTIQWQTGTASVNVKGRFLTSDVRLTASTNEHFTLNTTTLTKESVMATDGANFTVSFDGKILADTLRVKLSSTGVEKTITIYASAKKVITVANLAELNEAEEGKYYRVTGEVVLTAQDANRNAKWLQDKVAGILIDDIEGKITSSYQIGDGLKNIVGKLSSFGGQKQLLATADFGTASSQGNKTEARTLTIKDLNAKKDLLTAQLILIEGLQLVDTIGEWESNQDHFAFLGTDTVNIRTFVRNGNFAGTAKPQGIFNLVALVGSYNGAAQISPRTMKDIITSEEDSCVTPTDLKSENISAHTVDISWTGESKEYEVYHRLKGTDLWTSAVVSAPRTILTDLQPGKEYEWRIRAVCAEAENAYSVTERFTTKTVSNEGLQKFDISVYPNPSNGTFVVNAPENTTIEILSLSGILVKKIAATGAKTSVSLEESGIYLVYVNYKGSIAVKRMVVR